jgi:hypothetical protein
MYSLVSAPVLGFDLARLEGGSAAAEVLLRGLSLTQSDMDVLAASRDVADDWDRAALWQDVDTAAQERRNAGEQAKNLTVLERSPLGTLDGLLHCLRYDILDWTWGGSAVAKTPVKPPAKPLPVNRAPRQRQSKAAGRATSVLADAAAAEYLRELLPEQSRGKLSAPWEAALKDLPERPFEFGPQDADIRRLLDRVRNLTAEEMKRLIKVSDNVRPGLNDWAPAVHSASWAVFLSGRVRIAAAAQLKLVQAIDTANVPVGDRAGGVWNLLSGAVQAFMVRDLLDGPTARRLLDPYFTALGLTAPGGAAE